MKRFLFGGALFFLFWFAVTTSAKEIPALAPEAQEKCEQDLLRTLGATALTSGPEYDEFLSVVHAFHLEMVPELYLSRTELNARYIIGSRFTDGRGKILVSDLFIQFFANTQFAMRGTFAHELGHFVRDTGQEGCDVVRNGVHDVREEEQTDAVAAGAVGYEPLRAVLRRYIKLCGGHNSEMEDRLRFLKKIEKERVPSFKH